MARYRLPLLVINVLSGSSGRTDARSEQVGPERCAAASPGPTEGLPMSAGERKRSSENAPSALRAIKSREIH